MRIEDIIKNRENEKVEFKERDKSSAVCEGEGYVLKDSQMPQTTQKRLIKDSDINGEGGG